MTLENFALNAIIIGVLFLMKRSGNLTSWIFLGLASTALVFTIHAGLEYHEFNVAREARQADQAHDSLHALELLVRLAIGAVLFALCWITIAVNRGRFDPFWEVGKGEKVLARGTFSIPKDLKEPLTAHSLLSSIRKIKGD